MCKTTITKDDNLMISNISQTEISRHFLKLNRKNLPTELTSQSLPIKLKGETSKGKKFYCILGTENRLYLSQNFFPLEPSSKIQIKFLSGDNFEISKCE